MSNKITVSEINKVLDSVTMNDDEYTHKELSCMYRPWAVAFKSFNEEYYDIIIILTSFFRCYVEDSDLFGNHQFVDIYNKYLSDLFNLDLGKIQFSNLYSMVKEVKNSIDEGHVVIMPGDLYELSYNPMYLMEHYPHYFIIKGYDLKRNLFYILDNIHIDFGSSRILTDFTSKFDEMYSMSESYSKNRFIECQEKHLFSIKVNNNKGNEIKSMFDAIKYIVNFLEENIEKRIIFYEYNIFRKSIDEMDVHSIKKYIEVFNFKELFYNILLDKVNLKTEILDELKEKYVTIKNEWDSIQNSYIFYLVKKKEINDELKARIEDNYKKEKNLLSYIMKKIKLYNIKNEKEQKENCFEVKNNNKASIDLLQNKILIKHSQEKKYDTWKMQDDAVQILFYDNLDKFKFETSVKTNTKILNCFHCGIIVKIKDGTKYLFGNYRNQAIAIFCPELDEKYELYMNESIEKIHSIKLKVYYENKKLNFYFNENSLAFSLDDVEYVESIGLFSKTWDKINHEVEFYDYIKE
jgi:hypothetical protein